MKKQIFIHHEGHEEMKLRVLGDSQAGRDILFRPKRKCKYDHFPRSHALRSSLYTSVFQSRHTGRDAGIQCHGRYRYLSNTKFHLPVPGFRHPCQNDGFSQTLVYNDERATWECSQGALRRESRGQQAETQSISKQNAARGNETNLSIQ
jgi:hypothetical protein